MQQASITCSFPVVASAWIFVLNCPPFKVVEAPQEEVALKAVAETILRLNDLLNVVTVSPIMPTTTTTTIARTVQGEEETIDDELVTTVLSLEVLPNNVGAWMSRIETVWAICVTTDTGYPEGTQHLQPRRRRKKDPSISLYCCCA